MRVLVVYALGLGSGVLLARAWDRQRFVCLIGIHERPLKISRDEEWMAAGFFVCESCGKPVRRLGG
jgi:hypothetical protein